MERAATEARQQDEAFRADVQEACRPQDSADELAKLAELKASGAITEEEFQTAKARILR